MRLETIKIKIVTTGGTIDKIYFDQKSEFQVGDTQIRQLFDAANITFEYEVAQLLQKDSLDMTHKDRKLIRDYIQSASHQRFLVTHGTDTMIETAKVLFDISEKTTVLTGSMQPSRFQMSDAVFNTGFAIAAVQLLPPGVYIAMNGRIFDPLNCRKNIEQNCFETIVSTLPKEI